MKKILAISLILTLFSVTNGSVASNFDVVMGGLPTTKVISDTLAKTTIEKLYPVLPKDASMPPFTLDNITCDHFSTTRTAPPNNDLPTEVSTVFAIDRLADFRDVDETVKVSGMMWMYWNVSTCKRQAPYSPAQLRQRLFIPKPASGAAYDLWLPQYIFTSSSSDIFMKGEQYGTDLVATVIDSTSNAENSVFDFFFVRRGFFESQCNLDLGRFPFDDQTCSFTFAFQRSASLIRFGQVSPICPSQDGTEWHFSGCKTRLRNMRISGNNVSVVDFIVSLQRKYEYYIINLALPSMCLSLLELATFLMPPDKPDRPTFAVTILLALTVAQSDVLKDVPKTSARILLSDYILFLSCFSAMVTFYEMLACCLSNFGEGKKLLKRQIKRGNRSCSFIRVLDIFAFAVALAAYVGIHAYAAAQING